MVRSKPSKSPQVKRPPVTISGDLWQSIRFFIDGSAILGTFKVSFPDVHQYVLSLSKEIEEEHPSGPKD